MTKTLIGVGGVSAYAGQGGASRCPWSALCSRGREATAPPSVLSAVEQGRAERVAQAVEG